MSNNIIARPHYSIENENEYRRAMEADLRQRPHLMGPNTFLGEQTGPFIDKGGASYHAKAFGLKGDGSNEATRLQDALTTCANAGLWFELGGMTISSSSQVSAGSNLKLRNGTLDFTAAGAISSIISSGGSVGSDIALSVNAASGDDSLTFTDAAAIAGIVAGDWIVVKSAQNWNVAGTIKQAEIVRVLSKASNVLTLYEQLDYAHTTANTAVIAKITFVEGWHFDNVKLIGDEGTAGVNGINAQYLKDAVFEDVGGTGFRGRMLQLRTCYNVEVRNPLAREGDPLINGGLNYCVAIVEGCHHIRVNGAHAQNVRHIVTVGGTTWPNRHIQVRAVSGAGLTDAAVDAHPACDHLIVDGVQATYKGTAACEAVITQGARCKISNVGSSGSGAFAVVRWQPFIAADIPLSGEFYNVSGSGAIDRVVQIDQQGTTPVRLLKIDNPAHIYDGVNACDTLVEIDAEVGSIHNFSVTNPTGEELEGRGIYVRAQNTHTISHGTITGGSLKMASGSNSCIRVQAGASAAVTNVDVGGMVLDGGVYGVNAPDATIDYITLSRNQYLNQTSAPFFVVGSNSRVDQAQEVGADVGDAGITLTVGEHEQTQVWNTALTADRAVTLGTSGAVNGARFRIVRTAAATGAFNLNVGTGPLKALAAGTWCEVEYDGSAWFLSQYGAL